MHYCVVYVILRIYSYLDQFCIYILQIQNWSNFNFSLVCEFIFARFIRLFLNIITNYYVIVVSFRALSESGVLSYKGEVSFSPPFLENFYKYLGSLGLVNLKGQNFKFFLTWI